jgi:hypothetical protein
VTGKPAGARPNREGKPWKHLLCWLSGLGLHRIDLLSVSYGARMTCLRCGKDCGYSTAEVGRP